MKIKNADDFFKMINQCSGSVELVTNEGDRLNFVDFMGQ